jgi:hypothetical protein
MAHLWSETCYEKPGSETEVGTQGMDLGAIGCEGCDLRERDEPLRALRAARRSPVRTE